MVLTELKEKLNLVGVIDIHCCLTITPKKGYMDIIVGVETISSIYVSQQDINTLLANSSFIEADGEVYLRNPEKHNAWQHKEAVDYAVEGGENTYATYGDSWILNKKSITIIR